MARRNATFIAQKRPRARGGPPRAMIDINIAKRMEPIPAIPF
jgi:hypothetical protein